MKNLPFIPDEVVSAEDRALVYTLENYARLPHNCLELFAVIDKLAAAYLDVARERDQWKDVLRAGDGRGVLESDGGVEKAKETGGMHVRQARKIVNTGFWSNLKSGRFVRAWSTVVRRSRRHGRKQPKPRRKAITGRAGCIQICGGTRLEVTSWTISPKE